MDIAERVDSGDNVGMRQGLIASLPRIVSTAVLVAAGLLCLAPLWLHRGVPASPDSDVLAQFLSLKALASRAIADGAYPPLWDPSTNGGAPALGNPQTAYLAPVDAALALLPVDRAISLSFVVSVLLAGLCMLQLARRVLHDEGAALFAAIAYMLSWRFLAMIHAGWLPRMGPYALSPLLLLLALRAVERPGARSAALFALAVAACLLQGDMQPVYYIALVTIAVSVGATLQRPRGDRWRSLGALALGGALGVLIAAPALLPALQYLSLSTRAHLDYSFFLGRQPSLGDLATLLDPLDQGGHRSEYWENNFYFGLLLYPLAALAIAKGGRAARWLLVAVAAAVLVSFDSPLLRLLFHALPGFSLFRQPDRVLLAAQLGLVLASGFGARFLLQLLRARQGARAAGLVTALLCAAPVTEAILRSAPRFEVAEVAQAAPRTEAHDYLAKLAGSGRVAAIGAGIIPYGLAGWLGFDLINGYSGLTLRHWIEYFDLMQHGAPSSLPQSSVVVTDLRALARPALLRALDVRLVVTSKPFPLETVGFRRAAHLDRLPVFLFYQGTRYLPAEVYLDDEPLGPAYFATQVAAVTDEAASIAALARSPSPRAAYVLGLAAVPPAGGPARSQAAVVERSTDRVVYQVDSDSGGFLIIPQIWYPAWRLDVDGAPTRLYRTNHALLGCILSPGSHRLVLRMTSAALSIGLAVAAAALLCVAVLLALAAGQRPAGAARR